MTVTANLHRLESESVSNHRLSTPVFVTVVGLGLGVGVGATFYPPILLGIGAVAALLLAIARFSLTTVFLVGLCVLLAGYAFLGRGFAHIGLPPLYVGEFGWLLSVLVLILVRRNAKPFLNPTSLLLLLFMGLGTLRTIPFLPIYGVDALRDATLWGYGTFALAVSLAVEPRHFAILVRWYKKLLLPFLCWVPIAALIYLLAFTLIPNPPGSSVPILVFKGGDMSVHLVGVAAFVLFGLYSVDGLRSRLREFVIWLLWWIGVAAGGALNRGGLVTAIVGTAATSVIRPTRRWVALLGITILIAVTVVAVDPTLNLGQDRNVSIGQLGADVTSIFSSANPSDLQGTKEFRLAWWSYIISYTFGGPYFWSGKGFGVNLADDDNFQTTSDDSLRSPHNSHMTVLARMGVPGLALWIAIQLAFGLALLRSILRTRGRQGGAIWAAILAWIFIYWLAMLIDTSFDPYLEGPQGGIWFWSVIGLGLAAVRYNPHGPLVPAKYPVPVKAGVSP